MLGLVLKAQPIRVDGKVFGSTFRCGEVKNDFFSSTSRIDYGGRLKDGLRDAWRRGARKFLLNQ